MTATPLSRLNHAIQFNSSDGFCVAVQVSDLRALMQVAVAADTYARARAMFFEAVARFEGSERP